MAGLKSPHIQEKLLSLFTLPSTAVWCMIALWERNAWS